MMEMDQESLNLCKRLETNMGTMQNTVNTVLHVLSGNPLDEESGMINQLRSLKMDILILSKEEKENKKVIMEKMQMDKTEINNRIELMKLEFEKRLAKVEKWKDKVIYMAVGAGIGGGLGLSKLIDQIMKH